jgi:hypothetical protein
MESEPPSAGLQTNLQTNNRPVEASMHRNWIPALTLVLALLIVPVLAAAQNPAAQRSVAPAATAPRPAPDSKFLTMDGKTASLSD